MHSAQIMIERETGYVTKSDATFKEWVSAGNFDDVHIDNYFESTDGASVFEEIRTRMENTQFHVVNAVPRFHKFTARRMIFFVDTKDIVGDDSLELSIYPHRPPSDEIEPDLENPLPKTLNTGKMSPFEYYDSNLKEFLEIRTYPHIDEEGYWTDFTILSRVVSQRREIEGETAQNKKLQALGQMASGLAHDFNNMLTIILGRVQLLKSRLQDPPVLNELSTIEKAAFDSTDIIQRLQDFTRKRSQEESGVFERLEVNAIIEDVVQYVHTRVDRLRKQKGIRIELETQLRDVAKIEGNKPQLRSALLNIVLNAIDVMEIGVADTGVGMTKEVREKIFDPFFTTKGEKGDGLGLSEVYGIVNQHNGNIKIESTPGEGTTMLLYLPISVS